LFDQISREFSKETLYYLDYRRLYNREAQYERKYIAKFFILFNSIFVLQRKSIKDVQ